MMEPVEYHDQQNNIQNEILPQEETPKSGSWLPQTFYALVACCFITSTGLSMSYTSPALPDLEDAKLLNLSQATWFTSLGPLGASFGAPLAGLLADKLGRKTAVMFIALPLTLGWALITIGRHYVILYVGRFLAGMPAGMSTVSVYLFVAEIASPKLRGRLCAAGQLFGTSGILIQYCLGIWLNWQWLAMTSAILPTLCLFLILPAPETPRWLFEKGYHNEAISSLKRLRGVNANIQDELLEIQGNIEEKKALQLDKVTISHFKRPAYYKPLLISIGLNILKQLSGVNAITFYAQSIFQKAGFPGDPAIPAVIYAVMQALFTVVTILLVDRVGRKPLLITAGMFMTCSCITFGLQSYLTEVKGISHLGWLSLASLCVFISAFSIGWGPVPWFLVAEISPLRVRSYITGAATLVTWLTAFLVGKEFPALQNALAGYGTFWLFAGVCLVGVIFVGVFVPETKGKSLEELEKYFEP